MQDPTILKEYLKKLFCNKLEIITKKIFTKEFRSECFKQVYQADKH